MKKIKDSSDVLHKDFDAIESVVEGITDVSTLNSRQRMAYNYGKKEDSGNIQWVAYDFLQGYNAALTHANRWSVLWEAIKLCSK